MSNTNSQFPRDFFFGATTAAHQIEGSQHNDWTEWEQENHTHLAQNAHELYQQQAKYLGKMPDWDKIQPFAADPNNYISGEACDHWNRYEEDFDLIKELGLNSYRFSIEWSRIEPKPGEFSREAIEHYRNMLTKLRERNIEPFVTLWHFSNPIWVRDMGGWTSRKVVDAYVKYVEKVVSEFKDLVTYWHTLNEPIGYLIAGYWSDAFPPALNSPWSYLKGFRNITRAHNEAYRVIKALDPNSQISVVKAVMDFQPRTGDIINRALARAAERLIDDWFFSKISSSLDFIGVNHYMYNEVHYGFNKPSIDLPTTDMGWYIHPESIYNVTSRIYKKYKVPIIITENGLADSGDKLRGEYIKSYLAQVLKAIESGVDIRGYLHWSLMDNFEWDKGFWPRFGLIEVDYKTQRRRIKSSAEVYTKIISGEIKL